MKPKSSNSSMDLEQKIKFKKGHNSYYFNTLRSNLYAINYWNLDHQIQEILRRVYTRCFNNRTLLSYCRFFAIGEISSVSFSPAHDYDIPNTHTHSQSSHEAYVLQDFDFNHTSLAHRNNVSYYSCTCGI